MKTLRPPDRLGTTRAIIFNADDFGLTPGTNAGIIGAHRRGPVRSASLMVTTPGFADAVALAHDHPALDLGVHLALTGVTPLLPPERLPSLVGREGRFPRLSNWLARALGGRLDRDELRAELTAQLERALATGLPFSHLNSHHHAHLFAPVAPVVAGLAREYAIPVVRRIAPPSDRRSGRLVGTEGATAEVKRRLLTWADARSSPAYDGDGDDRGLWRVAAFRGLVPPAGIERWRDIIRALPPGVTEMECHPGLADRAVRDLDPYTVGRQAELRWLCDRRIAVMLDETGVVVTNFAELLCSPDRSGGRLG